MNPSSLRTTGSLVLLLATLTGCAHTATASSTPSPAADTAVPTGSRLAQPVDPRTGQPTTPSVLRSYSSEDLQKTGRMEIGPALQASDPAVRP